MNTAPLGIPGGDSGRQAGIASSGISIRLVLVFYGLMAAAAILWRGWVDQAPPIAPPGATFGGVSDLITDLVMGLGAGGGLIVASRWWTRALPSGAQLARAMAQLLGPLSQGRILALALVSGVAEEAFFRGALQPRVGWLLASLLFGLAHFVPHRVWRSWSVFALLAGLLFGALFELAGSLVAPAVAHALVNGVNLHWLVSSLDEPAPLETEPGGV